MSEQPAPTITEATMTFTYTDGSVHSLTVKDPTFSDVAYISLTSAATIRDELWPGSSRYPYSVQVRLSSRDGSWLLRGVEQSTDRSIEELIEASSLGTPEAQRLRASVSPEAVAKVMERVKQLPLRCPYCSGRLEIQESDLGELECFVCSGCRAAWDKDGDGIDPPERRT